jgi:alanyl-tRNA synthetase
MNTKELKEIYLRFFETKNHKVIVPASLIPENDPSVLFTTAGMHPLVPFLLGQPHSLGKRLCDAQPCIRTGDIDEVGDAAHLTFFEMLGNWSLGDYFKKDAKTWSYEFLTEKKWLNLPLSNIAVTCLPEMKTLQEIMKQQMFGDL